jgi:hypothetical protein
MWLAFISGLESLKPAAYVSVVKLAKATAKSMRRMKTLLGMIGDRIVAPMK